MSFRTARENGYNVRVLNLTNISLSNSYNPFVYMVEEHDVLNIADLFMKNSAGEGEKEDFWSGAAQDMLVMIMLYQKTQGAVQFVQHAQHLFEYFAKLAGKEDNAADNLISQALDNGELSSFSRRAAGADYAGSSSIRQFSPAPDISELNFNFFTGQTTDLSYFSQSDTMPLSAIRNI